MAPPKIADFFLYLFTLIVSNFFLMVMVFTGLIRGNIPQSHRRSSNWEWFHLYSRELAGLKRFNDIFPRFLDTDRELLSQGRAQNTILERIFTSFFQVQRGQVVLTFSKNCILYTNEWSDIYFRNLQGRII